MLSGYIDGELDLVHRLEVERHLQNCSECARHVRSGRAMHTAFRSDRFYYGAPAGLERSILTAVRAAERTQRPPSHNFLRPGVGVAAFVSLLMLAWFAFAQVGRANRESGMMQQATCNHVRSLMATHLLDIASADPHVVKPWFNGKLDYAPPVIDLTPQGYPLRGGRLDYLNDHTIAALVYTRRQHVINLFLWPSTEPETQSMRQESCHGYHLCKWATGAMTYCAVSDVSAQELALFVDAIKTHTSPLDFVNECK